jgi:hypothetical protein
MSSDEDVHAAERVGELAHDGLHLVESGEVQPPHLRPPALRPDLIRRAGGPRLVRVPGDADVVAALREGDGGCAADARVGPGDDRPARSAQVPLEATLGS